MFVGVVSENSTLETRSPGELTVAMPGKPFSKAKLRAEKAAEFTSPVDPTFKETKPGKPMVEFAVRGVAKFDITSGEPTFNVAMPGKPIAEPGFPGATATEVRSRGAPTDKFEKRGRSIVDIAGPVSATDELFSLGAEKVEVT
jgi:hypothetical protein